MRPANAARLALVTVFLSAGVCPEPAASAPLSFNFSTIVDTNTPIPGGSGNFTFLNVGGWDGQDVVFIGSGDHAQHGVYTTQGGGLSVVADRSMAVPDRTDTINFEFFLEGVTAGDRIIFYAEEGLNAREAGLYESSGGVLRPIVDSMHPVTIGATTYTAGIDVSSTAGNVAYRLITSNRVPLVFTDAGGAHIVADTTTLRPGGSGDVFEDFNAVAGTIGTAFVGRGHTGFGIYSETGGVITRIADNTTPIPNGFGNMTSFEDPSYDGENVAWISQGNGSQRGVYTNRNGVHIVVRNLSVIAPGSGLTSSEFFSTAISGPNIAFLASLSIAAPTPPPRGLYLYSDDSSELMKVIVPGDQLNGQTVLGVDFSPDGLLYGNRLVFTAGLSDGTTGIYLATPTPIPTVGWLLAPAFGLIGWHRRRPSHA